MSIARRLKRCLPVPWRILVTFVALVVVPAVLQAQRQTWQDSSLPFRRHVTVTATPKSVPPKVIVAEFYTHGSMTPENQAVAVYALGRQVASRLLQRGPEDHCRVAFETLQGHTAYQIYYGGEKSTKSVPAWTATDGLLLETRKWKHCNLQQLASIREAFQTSQTLGSDYVAQVYQRRNPLDTKPSPFLSHYQGTLRVAKSGKYSFFTASQDCSFLLIDGKTIVSAPGRHRAIGRARFKGDVRLSPGAHEFDYWHAATGLETCMVAAWQPPGTTKVLPIPGSAFGSDKVLHVSAVKPEENRKGPLPDYQFAVQGDAPIENSDQWAVRVTFEPGEAKIQRGGRCEWDFGDGQTSDQWKPTHVYLHPGAYRIVMRVRQRGKFHEMANRVWIPRPVQHRGKKTADKLEDYVPIVDTYVPNRLDSLGLLQLVRIRVQHQQWAKALEDGKVAFLDNAVANDEAIRWQLVGMLGPIARVRLRAPQAALDLWNAAGKVIQRARWRAICALEAADLEINELLRTSEARAYLDFAEQHLRETTGRDAGLLYRVRGDWHARRGDGKRAMVAYRKAEEKRALSASAIHRNAQRGALNRSTEAFLRETDLVRAWETLDQWQRDYPADKAEGYLSMLLARYWIARKTPAVAVAVAGDLLTVNPRSPYADRLLMIQAAAEQAMGHRDKAIAACQSLVTDYPGSPLVSETKRKLLKLKSRNNEQ